MIKVMIFIQARSTSTRFPKKIFEKIDGKEVLQHVIDVANESALYINKYYEKSKIVCHVAVLVPTGDEILSRYGRHCLVIEGPEENVLERFYIANENSRGDYIVRLTSDCPLLPSYIISKAINACVRNNLDYVSNVDPIARTSPDGHDVEVMSKRALVWAYNEALEQAEKEHVTLILRSPKIPSFFKIAHIIGHTDESDKKISLDTQDDLERIKKEYFIIRDCLDNAKNKSGPKSIYRI